MNPMSDTPDLPQLLDVEVDQVPGPAVLVAPLRLTGLEIRES
jgi:hypothetical protein